jgi:hypothetical protein
MSIRNLGDFTNVIQEVPLRRRVYIDGPYGAFTIGNPTDMRWQVDTGEIFHLASSWNLGEIRELTRVHPIYLRAAEERGNVYLMASLLPQGDADVMDVHFARSVNGGRSFLPWVRVNDDPGPSWQWLAAEAVAPNGRIDAIWFDTRESGVANISRLYYAYSWDAGSTWSPNVPVSPPFNSWVGWPQQNKMGDYSGIVADATGADVAYAATFNSEQDVYYVRLFPDCNGNGVSDVTDLATHTSQDCNVSHVPDECEAAPSCVGAGAVAGSLTVAKGAGGDLALSWGPSCSATDADYAVYEGTLGDFASHSSRTCSTAGARSFSLTPAAGDAYYLIVPVHADREGSYGADGSGAERPQGAGACAPQAIQACGP